MLFVFTFAQAIEHIFEQDFFERDQKFSLTCEKETGKKDARKKRKGQ